MVLVITIYEIIEDIDSLYKFLPFPQTSKMATAFLRFIFYSWFTSISQKQVLRIYEI